VTSGQRLARGLDALAARRPHPLILPLGLLLGLIVRAALLPAPGLAGDLDEFVSWVHAIATNGIGHAYDLNLTFPPVMVYVWGLLGAIEPAFRTVTDASDPWIRFVMKVPPTIADLGLAIGVSYALRARPGLAVGAALAIWLHPAVIDVSALFGQYESIYVLLALVGYLLVVAGRNSPAAVVLALAVMTKPQALPLLIPFGAWFLARLGWRETLRLTAIGAATIVVVWLPFVAAGGPAGYVRSLQLHQDELFAVLSLRAWNVWWVVQGFLGGSDFISDQNRILGPLSFRDIGFLATAAGELAVFVAVLRSPSPRTLALGITAAALVAFNLLTTMHERYAYAALVFLALLIPERRFLAIWIAFGVVFTLNLLAAVPPAPWIGQLLPVQGPLGIAGSVAMLGITVAVLRELLTAPSAETPTAAG
jgi:Gpi18-like mannosyltransferase